MPIFYVLVYQIDQLSLGEGSAQGDVGTHWADKDFNSSFLFPHSFFAVLWEFAILIAKQEMSPKEKLLPNLNSCCILKKVLTFQSNGNADCMIFFSRKKLFHPLAFISIYVIAHMYTPCSSHLILFQFLINSSTSSPCPDLPGACPSCCWARHLRGRSAVAFVMGTLASAQSFRQDGKLDL